MAAPPVAGTSSGAVAGGIGRAVLFPAADDPVCEAAFDFALDHVLQPGDSLVLLHVAVAEPVASGGGGAGGGSAAAKEDDAAAADANAAAPSSLAARAYSDALPAADYFYAPARPAASLEAVQAALDRRFLRKLADVSEGQLKGQPRLVVVKAAADAATVARLVLEHCERERADLLVLTGRPRREEEGGGSVVGSPRAEKKTKGGFWGRLFGGRRRRREGGGDLPTTASSARDEEQVASAPVGVAGRHILRKAKCGVVVLRPVVLPDRGEEEAGQEAVAAADVEAAAAAAAPAEGEEEEEDDAAEEAEAERLPDTFEAVEYVALAG